MKAEHTGVLKPDGWCALISQCSICTDRIVAAVLRLKNHPGRIDETIRELKRSMRAEDN